MDRRTDIVQEFAFNKSCAFFDTGEELTCQQAMIAAGTCGNKSLQKLKVQRGNNCRKAK